MPITLSRLLSRHISPSHKVLFVGTFTSTAEDPSALYALKLIGKGTGEVHILDNQSASLRQRLNLHEERNLLSARESALLQRLVNARKAGAGDPRRYKKEVVEMVRMGLGVKPPRTRIADATQTGFSSKKFDVLVDAGTTHFILDDTPPGFGRGEKLSRLLAEYRRIAKKLILIHNSSGGWPDSGQLKNELIEAGAKVSEYGVWNSYFSRFPRPAAAFLRVLGKDVRRIWGGNTVFRIGGWTRLKHLHSYDRALIVEWPEKRGKQLVP